MLNEIHLSSRWRIGLGKLIPLRKYHRKSFFQSLALIFVYFIIMLQNNRDRQCLNHIFACLCMGFGMGMAHDGIRYQYVMVVLLFCFLYRYPIVSWPIIIATSWNVPSSLYILFLFHLMFFLLWWIVRLNRFLREMRLIICATKFKQYIPWNIHIVLLWFVLL